jgi:hypothetical protein
MIMLKPLIQEDTAKGYSLYVDLDGVLCDFDGRFRQLSGGISFEKYAELYNDNEAWKIISDEGYKFWAFLNWTKDGKELWKSIKKYTPIILSAPSQDPISLVGKKAWVKSHIGNPKAIYVPAKLKQEYADKNSILIDDYDKNINQWRGKGGIGILHKNTKDTLKELNKYL